MLPGVLTTFAAVILELFSRRSTNLDDLHLQTVYNDAPRLEAFSFSKHKHVRN